MEYVCIACALMAAVLITVIIRYYKAKNSQFEKWKDQYSHKLNLEYRDLLKSISSKEAELLKIERDINSKNEFNQQLKMIREEELDRLMEETYRSKIAQVELEVEDWAKSAQDAATENFYASRAQYAKELSKSTIQLEQLKDEINEYKSKQESINQEILRRRAIEEKQDFYRIQLAPEAKEDISYLLSIVNNFHNKETIYKLIWSEYIQIPFKLMLNRTLGGKEYKNVIYMIQNLKTQEVYIGKTRGEVSKRWTDHLKASLNIGTISHANIHNALFNHWDEFSFSILEDVKSDESLSEREKYYIDFYKSNVCGYNIKSGG